MDMNIMLLLNTVLFLYAMECSSSEIRNATNFIAVKESRINEVYFLGTKLVALKTECARLCIITEECGAANIIKHEQGLLECELIKQYTPENITFNASSEIICKFDFLKNK